MSEMTEDRSCWSCRWQGNNWVSYAGAESECRKRFGNGSGDGCEHWTADRMDEAREARIIGAMADHVPVADHMINALSAMLHLGVYITGSLKSGLENFDRLNKISLLTNIAQTQVWLDILEASVNDIDYNSAAPEKDLLISLERKLERAGALDMNEGESVSSE